jgi:hypothetical protein
MGRYWDTVDFTKKLLARVAPMHNAGDLDICSLATAIDDAADAWLARWHVTGGVGEHPSCVKCGRILAEGLEEWDDSMELLCFGERDTKCVRSEKAAQFYRVAQLEAALTALVMASRTVPLAHSAKNEPLLKMFNIAHWRATLLLVPDACSGCYAPNCSHLWAQQKKCCPYCSHGSAAPGGPGIDE